METSFVVWKRFPTKSQEGTSCQKQSICHFNSKQISGKLSQGGHPPSLSNDYEPIPQIDGNLSICSSICEKPETIYSQVGFRPPRTVFERPPPTRIVIRKSMKVLNAIGLPRVTIYNARSLFPKIESFATDMKERETDVSFISEVWEKETSKKHAKKIEELLELQGIKYISTPRRNKRGGGAAVAVNLAKFSISKLNVQIPKKVEAVWGLLKPKLRGKYSSIIVCCFYSPPDLRRNLNLVNHLTINLHLLLSIHKGAGVILCGD